MRTFHRRLTGPEDVRNPADRLVLGMDDLDRLVERTAQDRRQADDLAGRKVGHVAVVRLRLDDRIEVAAIRDVDGDVAKPVARNGDALECEIGRDIGDPHRLDMAAVTPIRRLDRPGRCVEAQDAVGLRNHQSLIERDRHRADRAVTAHRQATARLDEHDACVAILPRRGIKHRARHDVVSARLEHQPGPDPVELRDELRPPRARRRAFERGRAARDDPDRIAAGVGIDAEKSVTGHGPRLLVISALSQIPITIAP